MEHRDYNYYDWVYGCMPAADQVLRKEPIEMSMSVPANTTKNSPVSQEREIPYDGKTTTFVVGWPPGSGNSLGIRLERDNGEALFPRNKEDEYIAGHSIMHPFPLQFPVFKNEELVAKFVNFDTSNSHFANAILVVEEI